jgi:hypothetical protein
MPHPDMMGKKCTAGERRLFVSVRTGCIKIVMAGLLPTMTMRHEALPGEGRAAGRQAAVSSEAASCGMLLWADDGSRIIYPHS